MSERGFKLPEDWGFWVLGLVLISIVAAFVYFNVRWWNHGACMVDYDTVIVKEIRPGVYHHSNGTTCMNPGKA